ncbi:MAG: glycosyltransferase family 39 protein [Anaerolineae bacterium]|nr:glycosyltransferase family 39 protein [Candidatus Roseilinea sp.]MDW8449223.1 glycosyltransferase family 39 protein [Anaerolineae bacterium]
MACCALAFLLAIWALDARGLWGDEAFSVWASKQPVASLVAGLDAQPPLYHLLLGASRTLWGESVFALRYLSVCCGVLLVAVGARLGRLIGGSSAAAFTALLLATSPILLYYAQEARMYALAALLAGGAMALATAMLKCATQDARRRTQHATRNAQYTLLSLGALFTHYYAAGVLLVNALALGLSALRSRDARRLVAWLVAHLAIALIFGAWFLGLQSRYASRAVASRTRVVPVFEDIVANFGVGVNGLLFGMRADGSLTAVALVLFALGLIGVIGYWRRGQRGDALLILGWIAASLGVVAVTAGRSGIVNDFSPRYYLFALLPLALAAAGWVVLIEDARRRATHSPLPNLQSPISNLPSYLPLALVTLIALAPALIGTLQLFDLSWQKSRYDAMIGAIRERARQGDGVVLVNSDQFPLLEYYGPLDVPVWIVGNDVLSRDPAAVEAELSRFAGDKSRVWLVNYGWAMALQPPSVVEQALNRRGARTYAQGFQDASLALYDLRVATGDTPVQPQHVQFGEQITLVGVRGRAQPYYPGDAVTLDLIWRADRTPRADYTVFMHLRRADDGSQIAAFDSPPVNGAAPTSRWTPGAIITDTRAVPIPADAPPGEYNVVIGWYSYPTFERLTIDGGEATEHVVERITILPR